MCDITAVFPPDIRQIQGRVLASHSDGTFTVKYADGEIEEDVPDNCMRAAAPQEHRGRSDYRKDERRR